VPELAAGQRFPSNGKILVGDKGKMALYGAPRLIPPEKMQQLPQPKPVIPRCKSNHFQEWITACKGGRPAFSNFDHAGPLTELVLLGNLAIRAGVGNRVEWDGPHQQSPNHPELNQHVKRTYRSGWTL
jgi:hypothetical protein